jgi:uncharacterized membrane-anchored protein YitT (DUF2179 family)
MENWNKYQRYIFTGVMVSVSALLQACTMKIFLTPINLLPGGFTGIASLLERATGLMGIEVSTSAWLLLLNGPIALICYHEVGKKFVIFSMIQVALTSLCLKLVPVVPLFNDVLLNICFGGFLYGLSLVIALRGNASTGGMDFIALYVSNKVGKSIWQYVFGFNALMLCIFGVLSEWKYVGYSILLQFISTKTIDSFYHRFKRVTLQITTEKGNEVVGAYVAKYRHGISVMEGHGGYSGRKMSLLHTVVSSYEVHDIVRLLKQVDGRIIVNVIPTEDFVGGFYRKPLE